MSSERIPISQVDEYAKKMPKGLKNFVEKSIDMLNLNVFLEDYKKRGGVLDGYNFHYKIIEWFLNLEMVFDKSKVSSPYESVTLVKDLPEKDIKNCLFYMNYILGSTVHTGGHDYCKMYDVLMKTK